MIRNAFAPIRTWGAWSLVLILGACDPGSEGHEIREPPGNLDAALEWDGVLELEEVDGSLVAHPRLRRDPRGGWLYWDAVVDEARIYEDDGTLVRVVGAQGDGPGEYQRVRALIRTEDDRLVTIDDGGRVSVWDPSGETLLKQFTSGLFRVVGAVGFDGSEIVVYTGPRVADPSGTLAPGIHVLNVDREEVTTSGFAPELDPALGTAVSTVEPPGPRRAGASVLVAVAVVDSVWSLGPDVEDGGMTAHILNSNRMAGNAPPVTVADGARAFASWVESSHFVGEFLRLPDGRWLANTWGFRENQPIGGLLLSSQDGEMLWEFESQLQVLEVDEGGRVYLWDREGMVPNEIRIARIR